jgi:hypothetical protein
MSSSARSSSTVASTSTPGSRASLNSTVSNNLPSGGADPQAFSQAPVLHSVIVLPLPPCLPYSLLDDQLKALWLTHTR